MVAMRLEVLDMAKGNISGFPKYYAYLLFVFPQTNSGISPSPAQLLPPLPYEWH